jgi:F-type H+-transporting ATPase subunit a
LIGIIIQIVAPIRLPEISVKAEHIPNAEHPWHLGPIPITNALLTSWIVSIFLILVLVLGTLRLRIVPGRLQNVIEMILSAFYDLTEDIAGPRLAPRFFPIAMTIFLYLLVANWLDLLTPLLAAIGFRVTHGQGEEAETVLVPILRAPSTDLNLTLALALVSVFLIQYYGARELGLSYFTKFINLGGFRHFAAVRAGKGIPLASKVGALLQGFLDFIIGIIELISEIARILSFSFRLFGNIFAGEVLLLVMPTFLPLLLPLPFLGLELFVGLIQAFIFAVLTLAFMTQATMSHEGH